MQSQHQPKTLAALALTTLSFAFTGCERSNSQEEQVRADPSQVDQTHVDQREARLNTSNPTPLSAEQGPQTPQVASSLITELNRADSCEEWRVARDTYLSSLPSDTITEAHRLLSDELPKHLETLQGQFSSTDRGEFELKDKNGVVYVINFANTYFHLGDGGGGIETVFQGGITISEKGAEFNIASMPAEAAQKLLSQFTTGTTFVPGIRSLTQIDF